MKQKRGILKLLRNHQMLSYVTIELIIGAAPKAITIASIGVPQIQNAVEHLTFVGHAGTYTEAVAIAMAGAATRFVLEVGAAPLLFKINENKYRKNSGGSFGEFGMRYLGFALGMRVLETALYAFSLGYVLDNGVFSLVRENPSQAEAITGTSAVTAVFSRPTRWMLYNAIVLKSNPLPIIAEKSSSALAAAAVGTKRTAYAAAAFITSHL
ncbi:MAG: hypothetical protein AABX69_03750 [Nanoarchaeota archaeon]